MHPTREGERHCAVVLDAFRRRTVRRSIGSSQTSNRTLSQVAIENRRGVGVVIQSDDGQMEWFVARMQVELLYRK